MKGIPVTGRFLLTFALGVAGVYVDHTTQVLGDVRAILSSNVVEPIGALASLPSQLADATSDFVKTRETLIGEKKDLVEKLLRTESELKRNAQLHSENERLRQLLDLRAQGRADAEVAEVINTSSLPFVDRVQLDKGSYDGLRVGEGVFEEDGVIGQVTRTDARTSVVTLLTDPRIWISTRVRRNGLLAVVRGDPSGSRMLRVHFVPADADLTVGDVLVTTGDGEVFPSGLPVARIIDVRQQTGQAFLEATARPTGTVSQHRLLMVYKKTPGIVPDLAAYERESDPPAARRNPIRAIFGGD